jgi:hypothetical protein
MIRRYKMNRLEFTKCGREKGSAKASEFGIFSVYPDHGKHCASLELKLRYLERLDPGAARSPAEGKEVAA